jgi:hypothetical protein
VVIQETRETPYMILRNELMTKTVRETSQDDRVALATYIIFSFSFVVRGNGFGVRSVRAQTRAQ